jgi:hypothetical protein
LPLAVLHTLACQTGTDEAAVTSVALARGEFKNLSWGGAQVERFYVAARRGDQNDAVIWSPDQPKTCSLGPVEWYATTQPLRAGGLAWGALGKGVIPFFDALDDAGRGTLRFAGIDCAPLPLQISDVKRSELSVTYAPSFATPIYVVRSSDRRLLLGDPTLGTTTEVARDVGAVLEVPKGLWIVESGQAVLRDLSGAELARTGNGVKELIATGEREIVYVDSAGLWRMSSGKPPKHLADDACSPTVIAGLLPSALAYFSPCDTRRLVIEGSTGKPRAVAEGVLDFITVSGWMLYTVKSETGATLWLTSDRSKGTQLAEAPAFVLDRMWTRSSTELLASIVEDDGSLALWDIDTAHKRAAERERGLASVRPVTGGLLLTLGIDGTLLLRRLRDLRVELEVPNVARPSLRVMFGESLPAIGYLTNVDPDSHLGELELYFVEQRVRRHLAKRVRELREVWWPETGIAYTTEGPGPTDAGLWFARVSVPCDKTADSPWACAL